MEGFSICWAIGGVITAAVFYGLDRKWPDPNRPIGGWPVWFIIVASLFVGIIWPVAWLTVIPEIINTRNGNRYQ